MSDYTPQHNRVPGPGTQPSQGAHPTEHHLTGKDLVAGDPPVPLTVWRTARTPADAGHTIGARLAARLIAAYSRPGEAVVDLTGERVLARACAAGARRHHPAWFTDASSLLIGPPTPAPSQEHTGPAAEADRRELPELDEWLGDGLTGPGAPPPSGPAAHVPQDASPHGATGLVVACWPLEEADTTNRVRLAWLLTACARLLQPGGCLILVVAVPAGAPATPQDFSEVIAAAAGVGLGYLQHLVAVTADTDGDAFVYHVTDEELLTLTDRAGQRWQMAHLRVHADLLVFSQAHPLPHRRAARRPSGEGGGRRD